MKYDFDKKISRENTDSVKYDARKTYFGTGDVLPMWVADMDFEVPQEVKKAVVERSAHAVYGYSFRPAAYYRAVKNWLQKRHQWDVKTQWIRFSPGIVTAINLAIQTYTQPGDGIIVQPPVYFPFFNAVKNNKRKMIENKLINNNGHYEMDFDLLEKQASRAKMLLLSSPHNPVGRCWTKEELSTLADICLRHNVLVVSDEIHNDLILPGFKHTPLAALSGDIARNTITFIAPSKTFNLAGLFTSSMIIPDNDLRKKMDEKLESLHLVHGNLFGYVASTAAYNHGAEWLDQLMQYIRGNFDLVSGFFEENIPQIKMTQQEATYLAWVDFRAFGLDDDALNEKLVKEAKTGFSRGSTFGTGGEGFMRINLGTQRVNVTEMLQRVYRTFVREM